MGRGDRPFRSEMGVQRPALTVAADRVHFGRLEGRKGWCGASRGLFHVRWGERGGTLFKVRVWEGVEGVRGVHLVGKRNRTNGIQLRVFFTKLRKNNM